MDTRPRIDDMLPQEMRERLNAARVDPKAFAAERDDLATCWTFLGFEHQLANVNDWFRAVLGGRSVIVQRFDRGIFAFENKCAHRGYPIRHEEKGNGPLMCGFHHWRYNHEGLALGIPNCVDMYGVAPRQLDARLKPVELAQAGGMIFGRFADPNGPTLEAWLGPTFPILKHVSSFTGSPVATVEYDVGAHWRYIHEITLDDYHIVAIHPSTFGKNGYLPVDGVHYEQIAAHSMYFRAGDADSLQAMVEQCEAGELIPGRYRIIQIFPGLVISMVQALSYLGDGYWYAMVMHILPVAHDRSKIVVRSFRMPQPATDQAWRRLARWLAWPSIDRVFSFYARRVQTEDNVACEHLQRHAAADDPPPRLSRHEERIGWFEEAYALAISGVRKGPFRWGG